ncbi:hypothetical protein PROFUN_10246 [Planoprotostelium fungivorum]|uniref:Xylulose kinase n=1 Tax=Planoprotostelium fungivorum TaxID=1890364 RepID=A0A2P6NEI7_9EUKA|nr:hypothetical protein PROFUN_10246 [Planoprotostelium fungivorum]
MSALYLGLDCSTQAIKLSVIDEHLSELQEFADVSTVTFESLGDQDGPFLARGADGDSLSVTTPTRLWVRAFDTLLDRLKQANFPFDRVVAVSGSGQQHGSVYWTKGSQEKLSALDERKTFYEQSHDWFSTPQSPIWMDSSTHANCVELEKLVGSQQLAALTGSVAYERFTVHQIRKIAQKTPKVMENTEEISLVSSFLASLLCGRYVPIDWADGSGMNMMSLREKKWDVGISQWAAASLAQDTLADKIRQPVAAHERVGKISEYLVRRYGFSSSCEVIAFSGDNPCSLAGVGLSLPEGEVAVSLGTSDTVFGPLLHPHPSEEGHVFVSPIDPEGYMAMLCYKNGSLTRQSIRDDYADGSWEEFDRILSSTTVGNNGQIGFYFKEAEITPRSHPGYHRFDHEGKRLSEFTSPRDNVRAVVEGQFLSFWNHCEKIGLTGIKQILVTGGASRNTCILEVLANVFGAKVLTSSMGPNSACLGAAYRAAHGYRCLKEEKFVPFEEVVGGIVHSRSVIEPNMEAHEVYQKMLSNYERLEGQVRFQ